ncbi:extracellular solute-binding protein [Phytohabitans sp. ZYX-F-186]|uniref:Extracellular solute-binding protein n=1 Tax=Phytohabitans maris TaxID=3071409 RepID=A0ABU0ZDT2_9ACTN|nr:extracellular solute-binding protein [Phytohabitans sp. ZYX-F-186]MDQ7905219.1 extracellular solute-binding protein [Phytohabitans sp. ZYX-F-186]
MALLTAGCGSESDGAGPTSGVDPNLGGGTEWQQIVDAANAEGKVVLYTASDGATTTLPPAFAKDYPDIELVVVHYASGQLTAKLDAEKGTTSTGADVAMASSKGWWDSNVDRLPEITGPALARYWSEKPSYVLGGDKYVMSGATPLGAAVNTDRLKELKADPITGYKDLLQPALGRNIGIVPGEGSPAAEQWWYYATQEMGGADALKQLASLRPRAYENGTTPLATDVGSGEIAVGFYATQSSTQALAEQGAPIEFVPLEPAIAIGGYTGIVGTARPNAAQVLANWLLSPAGQVALFGEGNAWTPLQKAELGEVPSTMTSIPEDSHLTDGVLTPEQSAFYDGQFLPSLGR